MTSPRSCTNTPRTLGQRILQAPLLGDGWTHDFLDDGRYGEFSAPEKAGYVTVDYEARVFRVGLVRHGKANCLPSDYTGRGWRKRLETDAQVHLAAILAQ